MSTKILVDYNQAKSNVKKTLKAGLVPHLVGPPGLGKSALAKEIAKEHKLLLIDLRLSQSDPTDQKGLPGFNKERTRAQYMPFNVFPLETDELPVNPETGEQYAGWLILFDEIDSAPPAVIAAAYKTILDRAVGDYNLHPRCAIITAGNSIEDNAIVNDMGTAMRSRMIHIYMKVAAKPFIQFISEQDWDHRIISFLGFRPDMIHIFKPDLNDDTFPCPRTWEFMHKLCRNESKIDHSLMSLFAGTIGQGAAADFIAFCNYFGALPTVEEIIKDPENAPLPDNEPGVHWAASGLVSSSIDSSNSKQMITYLERLRVDMQIVSMRKAVARDRSIIDDPNFRAWLRKHSEEFVV